VSHLLRRDDLLPDTQRCNPQFRLLRDRNSRWSWLRERYRPSLRNRQYSSQCRSSGASCEQCKRDKHRRHDNREQLRHQCRVNGIVHANERRRCESDRPHPAPLPSLRPTTFASDQLRPLPQWMHPVGYRIKRCRRCDVPGRTLPARLSRLSKGFASAVKDFVKLDAAYNRAGRTRTPDFWFWRPVLCATFPLWQAKLSCCGQLRDTLRDNETQTDYGAASGDGLALPTLSQVDHDLFDAPAGRARSGPAGSGDPGEQCLGRGVLTLDDGGDAQNTRFPGADDEGVH
jgi:hypothetical protein